MNPTPTNDQLKDFLHSQASIVQNMSSHQRMALLQFYAKMWMLETNPQVEDDVWDYISLAILLKQMIKSEHC